MSEIKFKNLDQLNKEELTQACLELFNLKFIEKKIRTVGVKREEIVKEFVLVVNNIPPAHVLPNIIVKIYNFICDNCVEGVKVEEPTPPIAVVVKEDVKVETEKEPEKVLETEKKPAKKAEKKAKQGVSSDKTPLNHLVSSNSGKIDLFLLREEGASIKEMMDAKIAKSHITGHFHHLKGKGFLVTKKEDRYYVILEKGEQK